MSSATAGQQPSRGGLAGKTEVVSDEYTHRGRRKNPRLFTSGSFKAFADLFWGHEMFSPSEFSLGKSNPSEDANAAQVRLEEIQQP